jgi:hypothetical protein
MLKKLLLPLIFLFIFVHRTRGQKEERVYCQTPTVSISADYCTEFGKVILTGNSSASVSYVWSTGQTSQSITVDVAGMYSVTATIYGGCSSTVQISVGRELVTNGDFSNGNTGFTTGYAYKADSAGYNMELYDDSGNNAYAVGTNGQNYHPSFYGKDHTNNQSGNRNFMLVNGHGSIVVWEETVPVEPNTNYYYSAWGMNLNPSSPARLQFEVNGEKIGTIADLNNAPKPSSTWQVNLNNWERFYYGNTTGWNSGSATTAVIRIIDLNGDLNGNDFGLDDISFASLAPFLIGPTVNQEICPGESIDSITYQVGSGGPPSVTGLPDGVSYTFDGLNLIISGTPDSIGTFNFTVSTTGCTDPLTKTGIINVKNPGVWTGAISCDWNNAGNWCCDILPTSTTNVEINSGLTNYPVIHQSDTGYCNNLFIDNTASVTVSDGGTSQVYGAISNSGILNALEGTMQMSGSSAQTISGSEFLSNTIKNLTVSNTSSAGLSISSASVDTLKISGTLSFGTDTSKLSTGDNIELLSTDTATANVAIVNPGNTITGDVIVDRYINTGTMGSQHAKSWQFLSTPTRGQTIRQSWMENGNTARGYGTRITSPGGIGFDATSILPSMKYYDPPTNSWIGVSSGNDTLYRLIGYMLFVRGDRTVTSAFAPANSTILRSKGSLLTGIVGPVTVSSDHYQSVGNPYASQIDFTKISKDAGIDNKFYIWDPYLYGTYGYGIYQTVTATNDWKPVPGGTPPYDGSVSNSTIQSGQAFFVYSTGVASFVSSTSSLSFTENCKVGGNKAVNFTRKANNKSVIEKSFVRVSLFTGTGPRAVIADGNVVAFSSLYNNKVDRDDALKIMNGGENFGLLRDGKLLAVEARQNPIITDTLFYYLSNVRQQKYQLRFGVENMQDIHLQPILIDSYTNVYTPLSLTDSTFVTVNFTSDPASRASDRFKMIFRQPGVLPLNFITLDVSGTAEGITTRWKAGNESGISAYEIQYSDDGIYFQTAATVPVNPSNNGNYSWNSSKPAPGYTYYRIKIMETNGQNTVSQIAQIYIPAAKVSISVAPNPVANGSLELHFNNEPGGHYFLRLLNTAGQTVFSHLINFKGGTGIESISKISFPKGIYQLEIIKPDKSRQVIKVIY